MKTAIGTLLLATSLLVAGGCGDSAPSTTAAEENAFKNPDKNNLPKPTPGTPMSTPATSSLDTGSKPPPGAAPPGAAPAKK